MGGESDPPGILQEIEIWPYEQVVYAKPRICHGEWDGGFSGVLIYKKHHLISARRPDLVIVNNNKKKKKEKKKDNLPNSGIYRSSWLQCKIERKRKERQICRPCLRTKNIWNLKVTVIIFVTSVRGRISEKLVKGEEDLEIKGQVETIQSTVLSRSAEYWEESWRLEVTCYHSKSSDKSSTNAGVKNSQKGKINNNLKRVYFA